MPTTAPSQTDPPERGLGGNGCWSLALTSSQGGQSPLQQRFLQGCRPQLRVLVHRRSHRTGSWHCGRQAGSRRMGADRRAGRQAEAMPQASYSRTRSNGSLPDAVCSLPAFQPSATPKEPVHYQHLKMPRGSPNHEPDRQPAGSSTASTSAAQLPAAPAHAHLHHAGGLAAGARLLHLASAGLGAGPRVAALVAAVDAAGQQLVAGGAAGRHGQVAGGARHHLHAAKQAQGRSVGSQNCLQGQASLPLASLA